MACSLCYERKDSLIDLSGDEAKQFHITSILYKFFAFCFPDEPKDGFICQKCWCKVDVFHQFYVRIEEIQGICYKSEPVEQIKCDTSYDSREIISNDDTEAFGNDMPEDFDSVSVDDNYFEKHDDEEADENNDDLFPIGEETDSISQSNDTPRVKRKYKPRFRMNCEHCEKTFLNNKRLRRHLKDEHSEYSFHCPHHQCFEIFTSADLLEKHQEKHTKIPCPQCGKMIQSSGMKKHIRQIHEIDQRVVCDLCGKVSSSIHMHKYHVRADHEVHARLQCDICKEWYKNKENLRSHMKSIHIEGPQTCSICGRVSTNMKSLAKHKKIHLEGSKERFKCIVCGKGFRDRTKLKEHSYIHSGVTDAYVCQFCGKAFRFGSSMYAHRKKAHPNEMSALKLH